MVILVARFIGYAILLKQLTDVLSILFILTILTYKFDFSTGASLRPNWTK